MSAIRSTKVTWEMTQRAVLNLEVGEKSIGYRNISKDKFDKFDEVDAMLVAAQKSYTRAYIAYLNAVTDEEENEKKSDMRRFGELILKYKVELAQLLTEFGIID
jgi:5-keto 4-deoxyuronate isomerase